ncbi:MAG: hypothetical protein KDJ36_12810 [Hyphomicrobiaceae bacterium]|nr:hypothetical protein [Hyphomicrobiaceae bacterium]
MRLKPTTREVYAAIIRVHLVPRFGKSPLGRFHRQTLHARMRPGRTQHLARLRPPTTTDSTVRQNFFRCPLTRHRRRGCVDQSGQKFNANGCGSLSAHTRPCLKSALSYVRPQAVALAMPTRRKCIDVRQPL